MSTFSKSDSFCLGFGNWNGLLEHFKLLSGEGSGDLVGEDFCANGLNIGEVIHIEWNPNRKSLLKYLVNLRFEIIETENSKWQVGDSFSCKHFIFGKPLYVDNLTDKDGRLKSKMYVVGGDSGSNFLLNRFLNKPCALVIMGYYCAKFSLLCRCRNILIFM